VPAGSSVGGYLIKDRDANGYGPNWGIGGGKFSVRDGDGQGDGPMVETGFACQPGKWYKLTLRVHIPTRTWEFAVDDKRFVPKRPLRFRSSPEYIDRLNFLVEGGVFIDAIRITRLPAAE
jgi:hypothetical protein